jgi:hypothetical protein
MRAEAAKKRQTSWPTAKKAAKNDRHSNGALVLAENKELMDLATDLVAKASGLAARLSPALRSSVGYLVRSMNCYFKPHRIPQYDADRLIAR